MQAAIAAGVRRFEAMLLPRENPSAPRLDLLQGALNESGVPRSAVYLVLAVKQDGARKRLALGFTRVSDRFAFFF